MLIPHLLVATILRLERGRPVVFPQEEIRKSIGSPGEHGRRRVPACFEVSETGRFVANSPELEDSDAMRFRKSEQVQQSDRRRGSRGVGTTGHAGRNVERVHGAFASRQCGQEQR